MNDFYDSPKEYRYIKAIKFGVIVSLCGLFVSKFLPINVSIAPWIANLISLLFLAGSFKCLCRKDIFLIGIISILFQFVSVLAFSDHLMDNANSLGTNANLFSWLLYILIIGAVATNRHYVTRCGINEIMSFIFNCSFVTAVIVFAMDVKKIPSILSGSFNSYTSAMWGFFPNKNMFGMVCALGLVAGVFSIYTQRQAKKTIFKCTFLLLMLVLSFCRTGWLFIAIFLIAFFLQNFQTKNRSDRRINRRLFWLFIFAICICIVVIFSNAKLRTVIETSFLRVDIGDAGRGAIQEKLIDEFRSRGLFALIFGIGYSEYSFLCSIDVHNVYLYTIVTGGIVKLLAFIVLIMFSIKMNKKCNYSLSRYCGISTLVAYLVISFFETFEPFEVGFSNMIIFMYILLLPMLQKNDNVDSARPN